MNAVRKSHRPSFRFTPQTFRRMKKVAYHLDASDTQVVEQGIAMVYEKYESEILADRDRSRKLGDIYTTIGELEKHWGHEADEWGLLGPIPEDGYDPDETIIFSYQWPEDEDENDDEGWQLHRVDDDGILYVAIERLEGPFWLKDLPPLALPPFCNYRNYDGEEVFWEDEYQLLYSDDSGCWVTENVHGKYDFEKAKRVHVGEEFAVEGNLFVATEHNGWEEKD